MTCSRQPGEDSQETSYHIINISRSSTKHTTHPHTHTHTCIHTYVHTYVHHVSGRQTSADQTCICSLRRISYILHFVWLGCLATQTTGACVHIPHCIQPNTHLPVSRSLHCPAVSSLLSGLGAQCLSCGSSPLPPQSDGTSSEHRAPASSCA